MCRLFGLSAGRQRVTATFWLLDAPDNLRGQSVGNPDGTGLGTYDASGRPIVEKQPLPAYADPAFAAEARERESTTFVAHVRRSSGTPVSVANTHPFERDGRLFAHNGAIGDLDRLESRLGHDVATLAGQTDSERLFALITAEIRATGDVAAGIHRAVGWVVRELPVQSLNFVLIAERDLWALRYPEHHELWLLERAPGAPLAQRTSTGARIASGHLRTIPSVVVASERLDDDPGWRLLGSGVLVHVDPDLLVSEHLLVDHCPPRRVSRGPAGRWAARPDGGRAR